MGNPLLADAVGEVRLLLGNEAIVRGAVEAGVEVVTCYPGTPSSEVPDTFFRLSAEGGFYFEYSTNEKVALEVAGGASLAGAKCLCTMKHVGVNVAADPLMTLAYIGAPGGLVLLSADDPGCHSSQNEQDNRHYARLGLIPCLEPATAQQAKDMAKAAFALSRKHSIPVMLRTTTRLNHLRGPVAFGPLAEPEPAKGFVKNPRMFVPVPAAARPLRTRLLEKNEALRGEAGDSPFNTVRGDGDIGIVATGISRAYLTDALEETGLEHRFKVLDLGFTHPLPDEMVASFLNGLKKCLILEELEPILETEISALAHKRGLDVEIVGKDAGLPREGEYSTAHVEAALRRAVGQAHTPRAVCSGGDDLPPRPPNLCAGCPHRATYFAARKVFGDNAVYSSDIGCYTLGILPPLSAADFLVCMGSSVSAGSGAAKAAGQSVVGFIGDSTFFHSGVTGLINAVYNRHDLLLVIMDNGTTAMTGHQPHPGVKETAKGACESSLDIETVVRGLGVCQVKKVNPFRLKATVEALEELRDMSGVRVLISEEPCPLYARRVFKKKQPMTAYVTDACVGRGECLETLACPAFYKTAEGKAAVDPHLCSGCMFCLQVCDAIKARKRSA